VGRELELLGRLQDHLFLVPYFICRRVPQIVYHNVMVVARHGELIVIKRVKFDILNCVVYKFLEQMCVVRSTNNWLKSKIRDPNLPAILDE